MSAGTFESFAADCGLDAGAVPAPDRAGALLRRGGGRRPPARAATARRRCSPPTRSGTCSRPRTRGSTSPPPRGSRRRSPTSTRSASPTGSATIASMPPAASFTSAPTRARVASPASCGSGPARPAALQGLDSHPGRDRRDAHRDRRVGLRGDARQLEGGGREAADHLDGGAVGRLSARPPAGAGARAARCAKRRGPWSRRRGRTCTCSSGAARRRRSSPIAGASWPRTRRAGGPGRSCGRRRDAVPESSFRRYFMNQHAASGESRLAAGRRLAEVPGRLRDRGRRDGLLSGSTWAAPGPRRRSSTSPRTCASASRRGRARRP